MNELNKHVDRLFYKYKHHPNAKELKEEILGNLEEKKADLMAGGLSEHEAIAKTIKDMGTVDHLIDDNVMVYDNRAKREWLQSTLVYVLIAWILSIPLALFGMYINIPLIMFAAVALMGILYIVDITNKDPNHLDQAKYIDTNKYVSWEKYSWIAWAILVAVNVVIVTGVRFGSNIYFERVIKIDGPYQLAHIIIQYVLPLLAIVVPLSVRRYCQLIRKHRGGDKNA